MNADDFRRIALSLPESFESAHMQHPDFRVGGKVFATLAPAPENFGVVMLSSELQSEFIQANPAAFSPVSGGWGQRGATRVQLEAVDAETLRRAITTAWLRKAPKRLGKMFLSEQ